MDLIYHRGFNCRLASIISIASSLGAPWPDAFATLWSETDFAKEKKYNIYASKRVYVNLHEMGVRIEPLGEGSSGRDKTSPLLPAETVCPPAETPQHAPPFAGDLLLVGMDTFHIPWHPVAGHFHGLHFFFALKEAGILLCFDPVYGKENIKITQGDFLPRAFELCRIYKVNESPPKTNLRGEASAVLESHPQTLERLFFEISNRRESGREDITALIKQIGAMIDNRRLFRHYLNNYALNDFDDSFLMRWEAVRNGLYKMLILKDNGAVTDEVCSLLAGLMDEEMGMARDIAAAQG